MSEPASAVPSDAGAVRVPAGRPDRTDGGCPLCRKHRGEGDLVGPVVYEDDLVHVSHRADGPLGYLFLETQRHVAGLQDLSDAEASRLGRLRTALARGLHAELAADRVHALVAGLGVAHFHEHLFVRHPGTPSDHPWWRQWDGGPHGDAQGLAERLRARLLRP